MGQWESVAPPEAPDTPQRRCPGAPPVFKWRIGMREGCWQHDDASVEEALPWRLRGVGDQSQKVTLSPAV